MVRRGSYGKSSGKGYGKKSRSKKGGSKSYSGKRAYKRQSGTKTKGHGTKKTAERRSPRNYGDVKWKQPKGYLIIVEKPSVAKKFKEAFDLNKVERHKKITYYRGTYKGKEITVVPLAGHVLEIKFPKAKFKVFPIAPDKIEFEPAEGKTAFLELLKKEMPDKYIVFATDWDREGELISYEVYRYFNVPKERHYRMHFSALTKEDIRKSFENALRNDEKLDENLAKAGLLRAYVDKLYGFNVTRLITNAITEEDGNFQLWSAGRVQTPTLRLLLERQREIEEFVPLKTVKLNVTVSIPEKRFRDVLTSVSVIIPYKKVKETKDKEEIKTIVNKFKDFIRTAKLLGYNVYILDNKGNEHKAELNTVQSILDSVEDVNFVRLERISDNASVDASFEKEEVREKPPTPFDTTKALSEISKKLRMKSNDVSKILQKLYEDARISYPRTDSNRFDEKKYPQSYHKELLTKVLGKAYPEAKNVITYSPRSAGKKLDPAHPPIHPKGTPDGLTGVYFRVYDIIARRYIALFYPDLVKVKGVLSLSTPLKVAKTYEYVKELGWKKVVEPKAKAGKNNIPDLAGVRKVEVISVAPELGETRPPEPYTTSSIIAKMEAVKIGTKSTRPEILTTLEQRKYITVNGNNVIRVTEKGRKLVELFDNTQEGKVKELSTIDFTANLEDEITAVERGEEKLESLIEKHKSIVTSLGREDLEKVRKAYKRMKGFT